MTLPVQILHLEDDPLDAELIRRKLEADGFPCELTWVDGKKAFESTLERGTFDLVLSDYNLPDYDGMSALNHIRQTYPELPVIVISGTVGEDEAVECLKAGATDYVLKQRLQRLGSAVRRALAEKAEHEKRLETEHALLESEERFRSAMHHSAIGMALAAPNGKWLEVNQALCRMTGYSEKELLATNFQSITHPDDLAADLERVRRMLAREIDSYQLEKRYIRRDGGIVWISLGVSLLWNPNGEPRHFIAQIQDITLRKQQEERIARLSRMHALLSGVNSLIVRTRDSHKLFEEVCQLAVEKGGFAFAWIGLPVSGATKVTPVAFGGANSSYLDEIGRMLEQETADPGVVARVLAGKHFVVSNDIEQDAMIAFRDQALIRGFRSLAALPLMNDGKVDGVFVLYASSPGTFDAEELGLLSELAGDISFALAHIKKEEQINYLAYYDTLTGLPNRTLLLDRCNQLLRTVERTGKSVALVVIDLERFRLVNQSLGRHVGDALLKGLAHRLRTVASGSDSVARTGADTFVLMAPLLRSDRDIARMFEEQIVPAVGAPIEFEGNEHRLSVKAGIAMGPADGRDAETLLQNAESALARAKHSGEQWLFHEPQMNVQVEEQLTLERRLRVALEREQFVLQYQPKFDARTRTMTGLEALIRWAEPDAGLVAPAKFIPVLEETRMILDVGKWVLQKALSDYEKWLADGLEPPRIAVNVSAIQLRQKNFPEMVRDLMAGSRRAVDRADCGLDLEITESVVMEGVEHNVAKLNAIRELGVGIHIDDFGTGYSSLSYIAQLPIDALKIDRAFVNNMLSSAPDRSLVSTIITLGHSLNLSVVAEGVETEEQHELLVLLECDQVQGYLLSRPMPAEQVATTLSLAARG